MVLLTVMITLWSRGPASVSMLPEAGDHLRQVVQDRPIYWLPPEPPEPAILFHSRLHPVALPSGQLDQVRREQAEFYLLASADQPLRAGPGMQLVMTLPDGRIGLWRVTGHQP